MLRVAMRPNNKIINNQLLLLLFIILVIYSVLGREPEYFDVSVCLFVCLCVFMCLHVREDISGTNVQSSPIFTPPSIGVL